MAGRVKKTNPAMGRTIAALIIIFTWNLHPAIGLPLHPEKAGV